MSLHGLGCVKTRKIEKSRECFFLDQLKPDSLGNVCATIGDLVQQSKVIFNRLLDHLVGRSEQRGGNCEAECLRGLEIDNEFNLPSFGRWLLCHVGVCRDPRSIGLHEAL